MTLKIPRRLERYRRSDGPWRSRRHDGPNGLFDIPTGALGFGAPVLTIRLVVSNGMGWEHVSVSILYTAKTPPWDLMTAIKQALWAPEDCVVQYHPPESEYVNHHPGCLHLWRPTEALLPRPPWVMVGPREEKG